MKIVLACHGNIARSQILHHYLVQYAAEAGLALEVFSCGTAPKEAYPHAAVLLAQVQRELDRRRVNGHVLRHPLDQAALNQLEEADHVLAADRAVQADILRALEPAMGHEKVCLFYEFIGEGGKDFTDTYDPETSAQNPTRFSACFDELARIAGRIVERLQPATGPDQP